MVSGRGPKVVLSFGAWQEWVRCEQRNVSPQPQLALVRVQLKLPSNQSLRLTINRGALDTRVPRVNHSTREEVSQQVALKIVDIPVRPQMLHCNHMPNTAGEDLLRFRSAKTNQRPCEPSLHPNSSGRSTLARGAKVTRVTITLSQNT